MKNRLLAIAGITTVVLFVAAIAQQFRPERPAEPWRLRRDADGVARFYRPPPLCLICDAGASRNSAGTYSLASSPVTTLQTISVSLWNNIFNDLATGVTDSLDRNGRGGMLAALRGVDGTVAAPAFSWTSETGSGLYRIGANNPGLAVNGSKRQEWSTTGTTVTGTATVTGAATLSSTLGVTGATTLSDVLTANVSGTGSTFLASFFEASLANGNNATVLVGKSSSANSGAGFSFTPNATAANSKGCLQVTGQTGTLCVDGSNVTTTAGTLATGGVLQIGSLSTTVTTITFGLCALNGGSPSQCTATVPSGGRCTANGVGTTAAKAIGVAVSITGTTGTFTAANGLTDNVHFICFG